MKKMCIFLCLVTLLTSSPIFANVADASQEYSKLSRDTNSFPKDVVTTNQIVETYKRLLETRKNRIPHDQLFEEKQLDSVFTDDFQTLGILGNEDKDSRESIFMKNDFDVFANITYNDDSGIYTLLIADEKTDDIILMVDEEEFRITEEIDGSINMYSENGNTTPIIEVLDDTGADIIINELKNNPIFTLKEQTSIRENSKLNSPYRFGPYGNTIGPFTKTNKAWIDVITILGFTASGVTIKANHPTIGIITLVVSIGVYVGDKITQTFWIRYYQSFSLSPTYYYKYMLQQEYWFQYNNFTGKVGERTFEKKLR